jgi:hypothetical protein
MTQKELIEAAAITLRQSIMCQHSAGAKRDELLAKIETPRERALPEMCLSTKSLRGTNEQCRPSESAHLIGLDMRLSTSANPVQLFTFRTDRCNLLECA